MSSLDVIKSCPKVLVKFGYKGCPPCAKLDEFLKKETELFDGIQVLKANVSDRKRQDSAEETEEKDLYEQVMETYAIEDFDSVPQLVLFTNGKPDKIHDQRGKYIAVQPNVNDKKKLTELIKKWKSG